MAVYLLLSSQSINLLPSPISSSTSSSSSSSSLGAAAAAVVVKVGASSFETKHEGQELLVADVDDAVPVVVIMFKR